MMPAIVTMNPRPKRTTMPMVCRVGIRNLKTSGIGKMVTSKSAKQLITPAASVTLPSSRHLLLGKGGNTQYALTGL